MPLRPPAPRGVHRARWLSPDGRQILIVVDSQGRKRQEHVLTRTDDEESVVSHLYDTLDELDPPGAAAAA